MDDADQIELVRRHIADGERHVASQWAVVQRLSKVGADTRLAEEILEEFVSSLAEHRERLAQMTAAND